MHLMRISGLSDDCLSYIDNPSGGFLGWRGKLRKLLSVKGQNHPDFHMDEFIKMHGLLTFSFVRHPFERWAKENDSTKNRDPFS